MYVIYHVTGRDLLFGSEAVGQQNDRLLIARQVCSFSARYYEPRLVNALQNAMFLCRLSLYPLPEESNILDRVTLSPSLHTI